MEDRWLVLLIAGGALVLFLWNRLRVEVVGLCTLVMLIGTGLISLDEGISGFSNAGLLTVAAMFVLSSGLVRTGAIDILARLLAAASRGSEFRLLVASILLVIPLSAFVNNTPVIAIMIPVVLGLCRTIRAAPSRLLMPISFASQLGGTLTLVGTSTNLLIAGMAVDLGLAPMSLFQITLPAGVLMLIGVAYLLTVGRWLCPERRSSADFMQQYELRDYLSTLVVPDDSDLAGKTLGQLSFKQRFGLQVLRIETGNRRIHSPDADAELHAGDRMLVEGKAASIADVQAEQGLKLYAKDMEGEETSEEEEDTPEDMSRWVELIVTPRSRWIGQRLSEADLEGRYSMIVLGLQRSGAALRAHLNVVRLRAGDLLLVQARSEELDRIHSGRDFSVLGTLEFRPNRRRRLILAAAILVAVVLTSALGLAPILYTSMVGALAMFLFGCVTPEEAYEEIDWSVLLLIATMLPLGIAMQRSGAADWIARGVLELTGPMGPVYTLAGFYVMTSLLTEVISNNATAVVLTPVAVAAAATMGISPMPLIVAIMLAASNSFMTPIGYQTNTFIYGPGNYRFSDFMRVGLWLNLLLVAAAALVIPWFFPF